MRLRKLFLTVMVMLGLSFVSAPIVTAATDPFQGACDVPSQSEPEFCQQSNQAVNNAGGDTGILGKRGLVAKITQTLIFITAGVSVIVVIIGGLRYVVSGGDANGVQSAKNTILYALVGFALSLFAQVIVTFVLNKL